MANNSNSLLYVYNAIDNAYKGYYSNTSYVTGATDNPGYDPINHQGIFSNFTVFNTGVTTPFFATFIAQQPASQYATNVVEVPVYVMQGATDVNNNLLYFMGTFDLILNSPTNPSSSNYNIFLNMGLYGPTAPSGTSSDTNLPYLPLMPPSPTNSTVPVCDVQLSLWSNGQSVSTPIFALTAAEISCTNYNNGVSVGSSTTGGQTLYTLNVPLSSVFPQIAMSGITYRGTVEVFPYPATA